MTEPQDADDLSRYLSGDQMKDDAPAQTTGDGVERLQRFSDWMNTWQFDEHAECCDYVPWEENEPPNEHLAGIVAALRAELEQAREARQEAEKERDDARESAKIWHQNYRTLSRRTHEAKERLEARIKELEAQTEEGE